MAKLIISSQEFELPDGTVIYPPCEKNGLSLNCSTGVCGSCLIEILSGAENISPLTPEEQSFGLDKSRRLACQCRILKGIVRIKF